MSKTMVRNCTTCLNAKWCGYIHPYRGFYCPGMEQVIDNHKPLKEPLTSDLMDEGHDEFLSRDYKDVLNETRRGKEDEHTRRHDQIVAMPYGSAKELKLKAIAALLFFGIPHAKIMRVLGLAERTFYWLVTGK